MVDKVFFPLTLQAITTMSDHLVKNLQVKDYRNGKFEKNRLDLLVTNALDRMQRHQTKI